LTCPAIGPAPDAAGAVLAPSSSGDDCTANHGQARWNGQLDPERESGKDQASMGTESPSAFADAGLDFSRLEAVFLTHLHADHIGDLPGMLLYSWGAREGDNGPLAPIRVYGPPRPEALPADDVTFHRTTTIHPELPAPGTTAWTERTTQVPVVVFDDGVIRVTAVAVLHGRAVPALAYRFDTADGSVVFSGDTAVNDNLIALAQDADILVHQVADLAYLERHGAGRPELERMAASLTDVTQVGNVAERARVGELILTHYLPAEPHAISDAEWAERAGHGYSGTTTAGADGLRRVLPCASAGTR
jgi:ribonuclease BN (tRNA processing enzyme)